MFLLENEAQTSEKKYRAAIFYEIGDHMQNSAHLLDQNSAYNGHAPTSSISSNQCGKFNLFHFISAQIYS